MDFPSQDTFDPKIGRYYEGREMFAQRFRLLRVLGVGGMGQVWLAVDKHLDQEVALKFTVTEVAGDTKAVTDLRRVVSQTRELTHPHIVRTFDLHVEENEAAISMEYMLGKNLSEWQEKTPHGFFEPEEILPWLRTLCEVMDYAHQRAGRTHRDLKPKNVMWDAEHGMLKVADFDIGRRITDTVSRNTGKEPSGSFPYMSPQQLLGERSVAQDDIYSIGATLYELLTGTPPFFSGDVREQIRLIVPPSMSVRRRDNHHDGLIGNEGGQIPAAWEKSVASCLSKAREKRPASGAHLLAMLEGRTVPSHKPSKSKPSPTSAKKLLLALSACVVLGLVAWVASKSRDLSPSGPVGETAQQGEFQRESQRVKHASQEAEVLVREAQKEMAKSNPNLYLAESKANEANTKWPAVSGANEILATIKQKRTEEQNKSDAQQLVSQAVVEMKKSNSDLSLAESKVNAAKTKWPAVSGADEILTEIKQKRDAQTTAKEEEAKRAEKKRKEDLLQKERVRLAALEAAKSKGPASATKEKPFENSLGMKFVPVPIGAGPSKGTNVLFSIWETRRKDYAAYEEANKMVDGSWKNSITYNGQPSGHRPENHPVVFVSHDDTVKFCEWLTKNDRKQQKIGPKDEYRLPSDVEWSYAVGLGEQEDHKVSPEGKHMKVEGQWLWGRSWPPPPNSGNFLGQEAKKGYRINGYDDGFPTTSPVGNFNENEFGLYDLGGNVWEWCGTDFNNQSGARVLRGGSWQDGLPLMLLASFRRDSALDAGSRSRVGDYGFRCVLALDAQ